MSEYLLSINGTILSKDVSLESQSELYWIKATSITFHRGFLVPVQATDVFRFYSRPISFERGCTLFGKSNCTT